MTKLFLPPCNTAGGDFRAQNIVFLTDKCDSKKLKK